MPGRGGSRKRPPEDLQASEEWQEKRRLNNEAVHRTREKKRREEQETSERVEELRSENAQLERRVEGLNKELSFLKEMFVAYAAGGKQRKAEDNEQQPDSMPSTSALNSAPSSSSSTKTNLKLITKQTPTKKTARKR